MNLKAGRSMLKKIVGSFSYLKDPTLESSTKFSGIFPTGCYVCRLNNHKYQQCGILDEWKKALSANFEQAKIK